MAKQHEKGITQAPGVAAGELRCEGLVKVYNGRRVVDGVNLELARGETVGLLGPNGAGKTTTFYMIVGLILPDSGTILLEGQDITQEPMYRRAQAGLTYLPQEPSVFRKLSVSDNILAVLEVLPDYLGDKKRQKERLDQLLTDLTLTRVARSMAYSLSGGERRRVEIARALACSPSFMLLDEPFAGIDPLAVGELQQLVKGLEQRGLGILITDHNVRETLGICKRAYIVSDGEIIESGPPAKIAASPKAQKYYLGEGFTLS